MKFEEIYTELNTLNEPIPTQFLYLCCLSK